MEELIQYFNSKISKVYDVYEIFKEFFGEDRVDLQNVIEFKDLLHKSTKSDIDRALAEFDNRATVNEHLPFILIYFDKVTIKNEYDSSRELTKLYVKVTLEYSGKIRGKFSMNRAEYTYKEFICNYMHSHVANIPIPDMTKFQVPCTGSGPINRTIASLCVDYNEDLWRLFCVELDKFVTVESIAGTPYHRMDSINPYSNNAHFTICENVNGEYLGAITTLNNVTRNGKEVFNSFIEYLIKNANFKYKYSRGYYIAGSPKEIHLKVSNVFIKWYNHNKRINNPIIDFTLPQLLQNNIIIKAFYENGKFKELSGRNTRSADSVIVYEGLPVCTFKGQTITSHFVNDMGDDALADNVVYLLANEFTGAIIRLLENTLNYAYGNTEFAIKTGGGEDSKSCEKNNIFIL